eukprot:7226028-Ditylum_brightwellii.AAC.1
MEENKEEVTDEGGNVLVNTSSGGKKMLHTKRGNIVKCYLYGGNHYTNMCEKKKEEEDDSKKKGGTMLLTTDTYEEGEVDEDYGDWGSVSIGGFMFHQHGSLGVKSYK